MSEFNLQVETSQADFIAETLNIKGEPVFRTPVPGSRGRFYFTFESGSNKPILLTTGTTIIGEGYADPYKTEILTKWRTSEILSGRNPDETVKYRQDYGTILHGLYGLILQRAIIPLGETEGGDNRLEIFVRGQEFKISEKSLTYIFSNYATELQKDLLSFYKWVQDYNVVPLAIELMAWLPKYKVGSAIDLVCELDVEVYGYHGEVYKSSTGNRQVGDPKKSKKKVRVIAIVDFKSGKKGFYDEHVLQLLLYKTMLQENYGIDVEHVFNFAPGEWRKEPTYKFVRQDLKKVGVYFDEVMQLGMKRFMAKSTKYNVFVGDITLNSEYHTAEYAEIDLMEELYKKYCPEFLQEYIDSQKAIEDASGEDADDENYILEYREARRIEEEDKLFKCFSIASNPELSDTSKNELLDKFFNEEGNETYVDKILDIYFIDYKGARRPTKIENAIRLLLNPSETFVEVYCREKHRSEIFDNYVKFAINVISNAKIKNSAKVEEVGVEEIKKTRKKKEVATISAPDKEITNLDNEISPDELMSVQATINAYLSEGNKSKKFIIGKLNEYSDELVKEVCQHFDIPTYRRRKAGLIPILYTTLVDEFNKALLSSDSE